MGSAYLYMEPPNEPTGPGSRPPDVHDRSHPEQPPPERSDKLGQEIAGFNSARRLALVALLARGPRPPDQIAASLRMGAAEVDEHLRELAAWGMVRSSDQQEYSVTPSVDVTEREGVLTISGRSSTGASISASLSLSAHRILARAWAGEPG